MLKNPFFCGQGQKQRSGLSACLPPADDWYLSRGLTRSCDFNDARPSPLRIVKRGERTQSLDMLREDSDNTLRGLCRDISPTQDYHRALLSVTKRRHERLNTAHDVRGPSKALAEVVPPLLNLGHFQSQRASERVVSAETMSSTASSAWNSFAAAGVSTRVSSLDEHIDGHRLLGDKQQLGHQRTNSPNEAISLQSVLPHVLSPHVSITTDTASCYDGRRCIWAAIEISGKLSHTYSAETVVGVNSQESPGKESIIDHQLGTWHSILQSLYAN